ncbi:MAG: glycosyltransferase family 2 protein [Stenomitos rutilans HA7619-LM2]|jgi:glycosyltransferase involved in cell wall biosynthesis|nr:glycosyltransferase family 2 protein [Stenomitos rutilans HA7619-LM2]
MQLCEVRVPTYKRPDLLKRALNSLQSQTYRNWCALVYDDSPDQEGRSVVEDLQDSRILYKPHPTNLGRSKNIDFAFCPEAYVDGTYAFVLEDDNYLFPEFIEENIDSLNRNQVSILLRNQEKRLEKNGESMPMNATTRGKWFAQGVYTPEQLYARLFFCEGISNGGLFWSTQTISSDLQVGAQVEHSWHQELFRTLKIQEKIVFEPTPLCVFTEFERTYRKINFAPRHNRGTQAVFIYLIKRYGSAIVQEAHNLAVEPIAQSTLERNLLNALYLKYGFQQTSRLESLKIFVKSVVRYYVYKDPFKDILAV